MFPEVYKAMRNIRMIRTKGVNMTCNVYNIMSHNRRKRNTERYGKKKENKTDLVLIDMITAHCPKSYCLYIRKLTHD